MSKVRARKETGTLYLDFFYRSVRCREQTALLEAENRRRVQTLLNRVEKEIKQGLFDYAATFPGSAKAKQFATPIVSGKGAPAASATALNVARKPATASGCRTCSVVCSG